MMFMRQSSVVVLLRLLWWTAAALLLTLSGGEQGEQKSVTVINQSGVSAEFFWIDPQTRDAHDFMSGEGAIMNGEIIPFKSFVGHEFEIREVPNRKTGACLSSPDQSCVARSIVISSSDEQTITIEPGFGLILSNGAATSATLSNSTKDAVTVIKECKERALQLTQHASDAAADSRAMDDMHSCVEHAIVRQVEDAKEEIAFHSLLRTAMAEVLENYTCNDISADTTPDVETRVWTHKDGIDRKVHVKFERPASRIHVIENFIDEAECKAMEEAARPTLHRATVADGKGGSQFSENRKAMQAGIEVPWDKEEEGDSIAQLSRRVYDYVNHVLGLDIKENGQEDLMSIQYEGRGINDTEPDRYTPHCDGDCNGLPHLTGSRMATMVLYCDVPDVGGHTNFHNAGVHIAPVSGNGIFFSYIDPETKIMDTGFTEHSGCPVFVGEKKIVTQWVRYGVDDENPWSSFNTLGIKYSEAEEL